MYLLCFFVFLMSKNPRHLASITSVQNRNTWAPTSPPIWIPCAPILPQVYRSYVNCFLRKMLIVSYKCSIIIVRLNIKDYKIVCINLIYLKFVLFKYLIQWASIITINCLKKIICNKNVLNIYMIIFFLSNTCYIRMHTIELFSFF